MDRVQHGTHLGPAAAFTGVAVLLAALDVVVAVGPRGWAAGLACGAGCALLLDGAIARHRRRGLGPAGRVTATRAVLACGVAALTAASYGGHDPTVALVAIATVGLVLDAVDGPVARRTRTVSAFGARFDMEVDAFLIAVLSVYVAPRAGAWVFAIGALRYAYVVAGWILPWLRRPLPPRYSAKVVAAIQGVVLVVAASALLPLGFTRVALAVALVLLVESFARDVRRQWTQRHDSVRAAVDSPTGPLVPTGGVTALAIAALWMALALPHPTHGVAAGHLLRIPLEGLLLVAVALLLRPRPRRWLAAGFGAAAGALVVQRLLDAGFGIVLDRPFDPLADWSYLGSGVDVLGDSIGDPGARVAAVGAAVLAVLVVVVLALAAARVARSAADRPRPAARGLVALGTAWAVCAVVGVHVPGGPPVAAVGSAGLAVDTVGRVRSGIADRRAFAEDVRTDAFADVPDDQLLAGLRGKDVLLVFVESYGRTATRGSPYSSGVAQALRDGTARLERAGYALRSAYLTSPTFGAASWLAHATTQSGLWVDSERRYDQLLASDRLTLTGAFARAGWRTVFDVPANTRDWPEGAAFYGFDKLYDARNVGYSGPKFGYAPVPDQYTLEHLRRVELAPRDRRPVMAEIDLVSSHHPWTPPPPLVGWDEVGDGSVFRGTTEDVAAVEGARHPEQVRELYGRSIVHTWEVLVSFLEAYPDPDRVLVVLGDHEPHAFVSGNAGHDVPVTVIAQDPDVVRRIGDWGWDRGLLPGSDAPVWRMSAVRDRVLTAFGPAS